MTSRPSEKVRFVMPGFMLLYAGHPRLVLAQGVDGRDKPGHDDPYAIALRRKQSLLSRGGNRLGSR
jgi:hypothetical protein